jgi:hypothetical protein
MLGVKKVQTTRTNTAKASFIRSLAGCEMTDHNVMNMLENHWK